MFELYIKKLFSIVGYFFAIIGVYFLCFLFTSTIANFFQNPFIHYMILMGVPTFIVLRLVYKGRVGNHNLGYDYVNYIRSVDAVGLKAKIKNEILYLKSFQPLHAEILAFGTIILPLIVVLGISVENKASLMAKFFAGISLFIDFIIIYTILDVLFWALVHKKWRKQ